LISVSIEGYFRVAIEGCREEVGVELVFSRLRRIGLI